MITLKKNSYLIITIIITMLLTVSFSIFLDSKSLLLTLSALTITTLFLTFSTYRTQEFYNPLIFISFNAVVGIFIRTYYIAYSSDHRVYELFTLGKDINHFILPSFYVLIGIIAFSVAFFLSFRNSWNKFPSFLIGKRIRHDWNLDKARILIPIFLTISIIGLVLFFYTMGLKFILSEIAQSSEKRYFEIEGAEYKYAALGYYRWMINMSQVSFYLSLIIYLNKKTKSNKFLFWLIASGLLSLFFPFFSSSRSSIGNIIFAVIIILSIYRKINFTLLGITAIIGLSFFNYMTYLRQAKWTDPTKLDNESIIHSMIFNRNLLDISKTAHIINGVPQDIEYKYGSSFLTILVSPIPRTFWPEKPVLFLGKEIGQNIYRNGEKNNAGVPPGLIAELYINFGLTGIIMGMYLFGLLIGGLYSSIKHYPEANDGHVLLYAILIVSLTMELLGGSFSQGIMSLLQLYLPVMLINKKLSTP